jgi:hypothetical protein
MQTAPRTLHMFTMIVQETFDWHAVMHGVVTVLLPDWWVRLDEPCCLILAAPGVLPW